MLRYFIRLDDLHENINFKKWKTTIDILNKFNIKAIIGVIPDNKDNEIKSSQRIDFIKFMKELESEGHILALHGLNHLKLTDKAGLIPKNKRSEFAGLDFDIQNKKISQGIEFLNNNEIEAKIFIPPFHSFDKNTIKALTNNQIKVVYDGISFYPYQKLGILFFPQQNNWFKKKKYGIWSVCLHPCLMGNNDFKRMEEFIVDNRKDFHNDFFEIVKKYKDSKVRFLDILYFKIYFLRRDIFLLKKRMFNDKD